MFAPVDLDLQFCILPEAKLAPSDFRGPMSRSVLSVYRQGCPRKQILLHLLQVIEESQLIKHAGIL